MNHVLVGGDSTQVRLNYFKAYTLAHPALSAADKAVWEASQTTER